MPALDRLIAFAIADIASFCPITRRDKNSSILRSFSFSPDNILSIGIPVRFETTLAMSSSVTVSVKVFCWEILFFSEKDICFSSSGIILYCNSPTFSNFPSLLAISKNIEELRSDKTLFHGKTKDDYIISDSTYAYLILNSVCTLGLFLKTFYDEHYPKKGKKKKNIAE